MKQENVHKMLFKLTWVFLKNIEVIHFFELRHESIE